MKLMRFMGVGFFLLLFTGFTSCASTKAQNPAQAVIPFHQNPVLSAQATIPPKSASSPAAVSKKDEGVAAATPAKTEFPSPPPAAPTAAERAMPPLPMRSPGSSQPAPPGAATQPGQPSSASQPAFPPSGAPGQAMPPAAKGPTPAAGSRFVLNFDNADLYEVIRVMSQMMKVNYVIDPRVKGIVNIHTSGQIGQEELFPIFQTILKLNGATAVPRGNIYEIVPFPEAKKLAVDPLKSKDPGSNLPDEKYSIQIIPLKYIPVTEVTKILKPFLSDGADIVEHPPQNILVIGDIASNIRKSVSIIELFDMDIFANQFVRIYPVVNADVNEVAKEMERIFTSFEVSLKSGRGVGITFTPIVRINSLLAVSSIPNIFEKVESWLKELDRIPTEGTKLSVFVYYVQSGKAKDMAEVLKQVFTPVKDKKTDMAGKDKPGPPTTPTQRSIRPTPTSPAKEEGATTSGVPEGEISIVVDENTNALIIRAYQRDYNSIVETIKKLDLYPKQALIEVFLAEVTLNDDTQYGLEFASWQDGFRSGNRTFDYSLAAGGGLFSRLPLVPETTITGLRYAIDSSNKLFAAIRASATDGRLRVLTSPHILASNNKEAKIQIGASQPILTNTFTTGIASTTATGVVEGTIEYKDIGTILSVTPRISDGGLVTLDINVEDSSVNTNALPLGNLSNVPVFAKKTAKTTLSIMEGQTIVIGGLMGESKDVNISGIPFLSKIPILGALFGSHQYKKQKTETILLMTPHVISNLEQSNRITKEFREKVGLIQKELESQKKDRASQNEKTLKEQKSPGSEERAISP